MCSAEALFSAGPRVGALNDPPRPEQEAPSTSKSGSMRFRERLAPLLDVFLAGADLVIEK